MEKKEFLQAVGRFIEIKEDEINVICFPKTIEEISEQYDVLSSKVVYPLLFSFSSLVCDELRAYCDALREALNFHSITDLCVSMCGDSSTSQSGTLNAHVVKRYSYHFRILHSLHTHELAQLKAQLKSYDAYHGH